MTNSVHASESNPQQLWLDTVKALENGDFTRLDDLLNENHASIIDLLEANGEPKEQMDEAFTWACFTGRTNDAAAMLNKGVDPAAGIKTGFSGFHWAVNRGNTDTVRMLLERKAPLEQVNMYGGTVLGCALYSAVYEPRDSHSEIIEMLVESGAIVEPGALKWWQDQSVPSETVKHRVLDALARGGAQ